MDRFLLAQKDYLFADLWALCGLTQALIHPSAWKLEFSEVHLQDRA